MEKKRTCVSVKKENGRQGDVPTMLKEWIKGEKM